MTTFGYVLPNRGALATPENLGILALLAESLGYESVWVTDHIVIPVEIKSSYPYSDTGASPFEGELPYCEPLTTLSYLAGATRRVRLGTHVLVLPYRNPVYTAKIVATLDYLSGGRVILGVGAGWMEEEFEALNQPHYRERGAVTSEHIRLYRELWSKGVVQFQGRFYRLPPVMFAPRPAQGASVPIWVGGHSDPAIRRAAKLGDGWFPIGLRGQAGLGPDELKGKIERLRSLVAEEGRSPQSVEVCFSTNVSFAAETSGGARQLFSGAARDIAEDIRVYQDLGVKHFVFKFEAETLGETMECVERFAREVRPLAEAGGSRS